MAKPRLTFRRLSGLDRSGPPPPQTLAGAPLNPWTIPNLIGFVRLALIPVFLVVGLSSERRHRRWPASLFARHRLEATTPTASPRASPASTAASGALLDPLVDRLLVVSGIVVCWHFELLPRWALAMLVARELAMLGVGPLRHAATASSCRSTGRAARPCGPSMAALFFALCGLRDAARVLLYIGLALSLWSPSRCTRGSDSPAG